MDGEEISVMEELKSKWIFKNIFREGNYVCHAYYTRVNIRPAVFHMSYSFVLVWKTVLLQNDFFFLF